MIKIIAIGNILLGDDGISIKVVEAIKNELLNTSDQVAVLIGETDFYYCLENIKSEDTVIIIDSTYFGLEPGEMTLLTLEECDRYISEFITAHGESLVNILRREYREVKGYFFGIEIASIEVSLELSEVLQGKFRNICSNINKAIKDIIAWYFTVS